eukprot:GFKZ01015831.1.p1 GENE.GFKZ01015831.1~~GFKZ01015831.1.p1  ORF type:complete len:1277 (-),score=315.88 GFKZ01015831.1:333-4163(-)
MVTPIGGRRRGSSSGANPSPGPSARNQGTSSKKKKRASPGRPGRSPQNASSQARETHLESANALEEGIAQLDGYIEKLSRLRTGDDDEVLEGGRDWRSMDVVKTVEEVIDGNPKPSLEYTLGVLGAERVPKKLGERLRSQGARAFTVELRNRAIQRKKEALEEKKKMAKEAKKPPLAPVRETGRGKGAKGKGGGGDKQIQAKGGGEEEEKNGTKEGLEKERNIDAEKEEKDRKEDDREVATSEKDKVGEQTNIGKKDEEGMAEEKTPEKAKEVVEEPVQGKEDATMTAGTTSGTDDCPKATVRVAELVPRKVPAEVQPAKMDVVEEKSENAAQKIENKLESDPIVLDDADVAKEPSDDVTEKGRAGDAQEVAVNKEALSKSDQLPSLGKAGRENSEPGVAMHEQPTEIAVQAGADATRIASPKMKSDVTAAKVTSEISSGMSKSKVGEPSREMPPGSSDLVPNEKSAETKQDGSNVTDNKTAAPPDTEAKKSEPEADSAPPIPMEVEGKAEVKDETTESGRGSRVAAEEKPNKQVIDKKVSEQTRDKKVAHMKPKEEYENGTSAKSSADAKGADHAVQTTPQSEDISAPSKEDEIAVSAPKPDERPGSAREKEADAEVKDREDVRGTDVMSGLAAQAMTKKQESSPQRKGGDEEHDHEGDSSDAELDMIIDGVIQDASNREKSESKGLEDQLAKGVKGDRAGKNEVPEKPNSSPASNSERTGKIDVPEPMKPQANGNARDEQGSAGSEKVEKGDSTLAQEVGGPSKVEDEIPLQDEAMSVRKPAEKSTKLKAKSAGSSRAKSAKQGHVKRASKDDDEELPEDKDRETTRIKVVPQKDSRSKSATRRGENVGAKDAAIVAGPRKNKRRKERIQETASENLGKTEALHDEKESLKSNPESKVVASDPKQERRATKKVRKGVEGPGRQASGPKGSKKDPGDSAKARKPKEVEKARGETQRRGSRRLSYFREDFIDSGSRKTRLRRESSHLGDPTSLPPDTNPFVIDCYHVWKQINQDKITIPFRKPVMKKDAPGYFDVIKHPMDLSTVLSHLENKTIKTPQDFYDEMILICSNATTFNDKETDLYSLAVELRTKIRKSVRPILKEWRKSLASSKGDGEEAGDGQARSPSADSSKRSASEKQVSSESDSDKSSSSSEAKTTQRTGPRYPSRRGGSVGRPSSRGRRRARGRGRGGRGGAARKVAASESDGEGDEDAAVTAPAPARTSSRGRGRRGGHVKRGGREAGGSVKKAKRPRGGAGGEEERDRKKRRVTARKRWDDE